VPKTSSGCFVGAAAAVALLGFGLLATLLSVIADEPGPPPLGTVLLAEHGSAPLTATVATGRAWELRWSFDCSTRPAGTGSFAVDLDGPGLPPRVDEHGAHGDGAEQLAAVAYRSPSAPAAPGPSPRSPPDRGPQIHAAHSDPPGRPVGSHPPKGPQLGVAEWP
jgi:hypothetical protein